MTATNKKEILKGILICFLVSSLFFAVACKKKEGPFEKGGKEVDKAADNFRNAIEDAGDAIENKTDRK